MLVTKAFIKEIIDMAQVYVDPLELQEYYAELIRVMSDHDMKICPEYVGLNDSFDLAVENSGKLVTDEDDDFSFQYYGC